VLYEFSCIAFKSFSKTFNFTSALQLVAMSSQPKNSTSGFQAERPKRPVPASWMFRNENRAQIIADHFGGKSPKGTTLATKAKELWEAMSADARAPYESRRTKLWKAYKEWSTVSASPASQAPAPIPLVEESDDDASDDEGTEVVEWEYNGKTYYVNYATNEVYDVSAVEDEDPKPIGWVCGGGRGVLKKNKCVDEEQLIAEKARLEEEQRRATEADESARLKEKARHELMARELAESKARREAEAKVTREWQEDYDRKLFVRLQQIKKELWGEPMCLDRFRERQERFARWTKEEEERQRTVDFWCSS